MQFRTIYSVSCGEYSDYRVLALFGDKQTAEQWANALKHDGDCWTGDAFVEEFSFVPTGTEPYKVTTHCKSIELMDDGTSKEERYWKRTEWVINALYGDPPKRPHVRYVRAPYLSGNGGLLESHGADREAVIKAVADRVRKWKAGQFGGPGVPELVEQG